MSEIPEDLRFLRSHEWARAEGDNLIRVGISDHAQEQLGDLVYVELPEQEAEIEQEESCAVVESVKAASDVFAPVSGEVVEVNEALADAPELVNQSPYEDGWLFVIRVEDENELDHLLDADAYQTMLDEED